MGQGVPYNVSKVAKTKTTRDAKKYKWVEGDLFFFVCSKKTVQTLLQQPHFKIAVSYSFNDDTHLYGLFNRIHVLKTFESGNFSQCQHDNSFLWCLLLFSFSINYFTIVNIFIKS